MAMEEIQLLLEQTKGAGQVDLDYWMDSGHSLEVEIIKELSILQQLSRELDMAELQAIQTQQQSQAQSEFQNM